VLESENLFDKIITGFLISEYRHTKKQQYLDKARSEAYEAAYKKAKLILSRSGQKVGELMTVKEVNTNSRSVQNGSFYTMKTNEVKLKNSGFKSIVIPKAIVVAFEIL
jgi:hypothetical protein